MSPIARRHALGFHHFCRTAEASASWFLTPRPSERCNRYCVPKTSIVEPKRHARFRVDSALRRCEFTDHAPEASRIARNALTRPKKPSPRAMHTTPFSGVNEDGDETELTTGYMTCVYLVMMIPRNLIKYMRIEKMCSRL
jgi:hypothetical protein